MKESTTFSRKYCTELTSLSTLSVFEIEIWCYRGSGEQPKWILRGQGTSCYMKCQVLHFDSSNRVVVLDDFSTLCFVRADLSPLTASAKAMTGQGGKKYWTIVFSIEIHFGLTEFKARLKWNDDVRFLSSYRSRMVCPNTRLLSGESEIVSSRRVCASPAR